MTDHLSRQPFIDMLKTIVQSQRGNPAEYSLAIDGEWGCGKTWVLDALEEQLSADGRSPYLIFRYNAWENDFYDEPLAAILSVMIERLNGVTKQKSVYESAVDEMIKDVSASLLDLVSGIVYGVAKIDIKESIKRKKGFFKRIRKGAEISADDVNTMLPLKNALSVVRENIKKLSDTFSVILIVDELDRCLPEYAIKVLERLHHVCNALPVVQIAAYSGRALANAVSQVYGGQSPDETSKKAFAAHYLEKFFRLQIPLHCGISNDLTCMYEGLEANYRPMFDASEDFLKQFFNAALERLPIRNRKHVFEAVKMAHDIALAADDGKNFVCTYELLCCEILVAIDRVLLHAQSPFQVESKERNDLLYLAVAGDKSSRYGEILSFDDFCKVVGQITITFQKQQAPILNREWDEVFVGNSVNAIFLIFAGDRKMNFSLGAYCGYLLDKSLGKIIPQYKQFLERFCAFLYQVSI